MNSRKEIIVFNEGLGNCGISRVLSELSDAWLKEGHHVTIAYTERPDSDHGCDFEWNTAIELVPIYVGKGKVAEYKDLFFGYIKLLKSRPNAVAVSLSVLTNYVIGAVAPFVKNRIVISDRNDPRRRPSGKLKQFVRDMAFKQADALVFQTEWVQQYYQKRIGRSGVVIPNPINGKLSDYTVESIQRRKVIVTASRLNKQKNLGMLIKAFAKLVKDHPDYMLEIYGRGDEEANLKRKAEELAVQDSVIFKGFSNNVYRDIRDCAIYVCSSDYEGISNALLEALGLGMPTISTDCPVGGSKLLIENDVNGILIDVHDTEALYQQMKRLVENPELAEKLAKNAVYVREKYNVNRIAQLWIDNM